MNRPLGAERWDADYQTGRYLGEAAIPFVDEIIEDIGPDGKDLIGLYIGCGNGRNYIPLIDAGLRLHGMDFSEVAIEQLLAKRPDAKVFIADFSTSASAKIFDYIVALHVFQHGDLKSVNENFKKVSMALKDGGRLYLRVNSAATKVVKKHSLKEKSPKGGATITYEEGPKSGMDIHFFTNAELQGIIEENNFSLISPLKEVVEKREEAEGGSWVQWESIWQKA